MTKTSRPRSMESRVPLRTRRCKGANDGSAGSLLVAPTAVHPAAGVGEEPEVRETSFVGLIAPDGYLAVRFMIELVDRLGVEHGFDPAGLIHPRTQEPFGPVVERMRTAMRAFDASDG